MKYVCIDTSEFVYPDITQYKTGADSVKVLVPRGSYACAQILFYDVSATTLKVEAVDWSPEIYEMVAIPVERNEFLDENNSCEHVPERVAPFEVYDCLKPCKDTVTVDANGVCAVYFSEKIELDAEPGVRHAAIRVLDTVIPVEIEVSPVAVPEESFSMLMGYSQQAVCTYHNVEFDSEKFKELDTMYLKMLRRMHQNMLYCPCPNAEKVGENKYEISFDEMEAFFEKAISLGYKRFNYGLGFRLNWNKPTILVNKMESMSFECYCYLAQLLPALENWLKEKGWLDRFILGVADEPNEANATEYRALCGLIRKLAPSIKLMDAMSFGPVHGAVDIWIPMNCEYQTHRKEIETFRSYGDEIWFYTCCGPRGDKPINRFLDYPLLSTRYLFWAAYRYNLPGYLHWAANNYQPGQDPFKESCPEHHNADRVLFLPPGDTHIMYPGDNAPWMSIRLETTRESVEEYELFRALEKKDKALADKICLSVCREFDDVTYDPIEFRKARTALIRALEKLS